MTAKGPPKTPLWPSRISHVVVFPGPAECAKRSAAQRGRRAEFLNPVLLILPDPFKAKFLTSISGFPLPNPLPEAAHSAGPTQFFLGFVTPGASWSKKSRSKRPSKTDQILMPFQHRFLTVLAPFWKPKMSPKSIKNRSKLSFRTFLFPHRFLHRFLIAFCSQLRPPGSQKSKFFIRKNIVFQKPAFQR